MKTILFLLVVLVCSMTIIYADTGKDQFEKQCKKCHSLERSLKKSKKPAAWKKTTVRMAKYSRGKISAEDAEKIADFLANRPQNKENIELKSRSQQTLSQKIKKHIEQGVDKGQNEHDLFSFKKVRVKQFIDPSVCQPCHFEIFKQWQGSMHSNAFTDPVWRAATKLFFKDVKKPGEIKEMKACVKCHTPLGFRSHSISSPADDYDQLDKLSAQGIFCNWCHNIDEIKHIGDAAYEVAPGGGEDDPSIMLGPLHDAESDFHPTQYKEHFRQAKFCGLCHNVRHFANQLPLEATYDEWFNSPYNTGDPKTTVNCQDCHMRQRPGVAATGKTKRPLNPGKACISGPEREHVPTHYFVGGNAITTKILGNDLHADMAQARLKNAADLEIIASSPYLKNEISHLKVKVINSGAGHYLPTGLTEVRQMWLQVKITDGRGKILLSSGELDSKGNIDRNAVLFNTVVGDENGNPVVNVALADRILTDYRVPPKGFTIDRYSFIVPDEAVSPLKVAVTLKYRSASQSLINVLFREKTFKIPVIDMTSIEKEIKF